MRFLGTVGVSIRGLFAIEPNMTRVPRPFLWQLFTPAAFALVPHLREFMRKPGSPGLKRWLFRSVFDPYTNFSSAAMSVRSTFGAEFEGTLGGVVLRRLFHFGVFEPNLTAWLTDQLRPGDTFLDVGANVGYFTLLASSLVGPAGRVIAVEASPSTFAALRRHLERNAATNVRAINAAAYDRVATLPIYHLPEEENTGGASLVREIGPVEAMVEAMPLAGMIADSERSRMRIVKIDIEGAELQALRGLAPAFDALPRDVQIVVELMPANYTDVFAFMQQAGFVAFVLSNPMDPIAKGSGYRAPSPIANAGELAGETMEHGVCYVIFRRP